MRINGTLVVNAITWPSIVEEGGKLVIQPAARTVMVIEVGV